MIILRIIFILVTIYLLLCTAIYFFQEKLIFFPEKLSRSFKYQLAVPFKELNYEISEKVLINAIKLEAKNSKGIILYFHGNAGSLDGWAGVGTPFIKMGYDFLIIDYRGYGKSTGELSELGLYQDADFIYESLKKDYREEDIILYGRSLGTGMASYLASKNNPSKLILETPFYDLAHMARLHYRIFPSFLLRYEFSNHKNLKSIKCPVYIIHGTDDEIIFYKSGEKLKPLLKEGDEFITIEGGNHNDLSVYPKYHEVVNRLLK